MISVILPIAQGIPVNVPIPPRCLTDLYLISTSGEPRLMMNYGMISTLRSILADPKWSDSILQELLL